MSNATELPLSADITHWTDQTSLTSNGSTGRSNETFEEPPLTEFRTIILPCIYAIVIFVGLIGNGLVIYIMQVKVRNKNITDVYVLNLAIADFIFVSMLPLWTVELAIDGWPFGGPMCKIASGCTYFDMYASVFFMTAMAVDRFFAVVMYQTVRRTKLRARVIVISIWIFSSALGVVPMCFRGIVLQGYDALPKCSWTFNETVESDGFWFMMYTMTRSVVGFLIPLLIILICYSSIIIFLQSRGTAGKLTEKCQDRATKMVLVVIGVFLVCWLPNQVSNLVYVIDTLRHAEPALAHYYVHMFTTTLAWAHSCVNPILYAFMREDLRIKITEIYYNIKKCCLCGKAERRIQNIDMTEMSMTPKTGKRLFMKREEDTQFLRLTQIDGIHKTSNESLAVSIGTTDSANPDKPNENNSLLWKPSASPTKQSPASTEQGEDQVTSDFHETREIDVNKSQSNHVTDSNTSAKDMIPNSASQDQSNECNQEHDLVLL